MAQVAADGSAIFAQWDANIVVRRFVPATIFLADVLRRMDRHQSKKAASNWMAMRFAAAGLSAPIYVLIRTRSASAGGLTS